MKLEQVRSCFPDTGVRCSGAPEEAWACGMGQSELDTWQREKGDWLDVAPRGTVAVMVLLQWSKLILCPNRISDQLTKLLSLNLQVNQRYTY